MNTKRPNEGNGNVPRRNLPRIPPPPLEGPRIKRHFECIWQILRGKTQLATELSPVTIGNVREFFVREFLELHLPGDLSVGTGHILDVGGDASQQIDVLVSHRSGLALPMGDVRMVFSDRLVACIEVKSTLKREDFFKQIVPMFRALPETGPGRPKPLKVVVAVQLEKGCQHRGLLEKWAREGKLTPDALPDLVVILDNAAVIKGGTLECLKGTDCFGEETGQLYKCGDYTTQKWVGLMLLVFEIAQRAGAADWVPYIRQVLEDKAGKIEVKKLVQE